MQRRSDVSPHVQVRRHPTLNHQPKVPNLRAHWIEIDTRKLPVIIEADDFHDRKATTTKIIHHASINKSYSSKRRASTIKGGAVELGLCEQCYNINLHELGKPNLSVSYHRSFCALAASARTCLLCHMLLKQAPVPSKEATFAYDNNRLITISTTNMRNDLHTQAGSLMLDKFIAHFPVLSQHGNKKLNLPVRVQILAGRESQAAANGDVVGRRAHGGSNILCVVNWLGECLKKHRMCHAAQYDASIAHVRPPRLLDLGSHSKSIIRLIDTSHTFKSPYLVLAYNESEDRSTKTTTKNVQARRQVINMAKLPRVFRQAVQITRELGFRYLWIKSLCTITDLSKDVGKHVPRVGLIYRNATVTLSALGVLSVDDNMIRTGNQVHEEAKIPYRTSGGTPLGHFYITDQSLPSFEDDVLRYDAYSRNHSFQPRLLSTRILHFGTHQLFWECHCGLWSESSSARLSISPSDHVASLRHALLMHKISASTVTPVQPFPRRVPSDPASSLISTMHNLWYRIISYYTLLTDDKCLGRGSRVASVAYLLACVSATSSSDKYLAGLWQADLPVGLLWSPSSFRSWVPAHVVYPAVARAPSWSWISVDGPITWPTIVSVPRRIFARFVAVGSFHVRGTDQEFSTLRIKGKIARLSSLHGFRPEDQRYKQALRQADLERINGGDAVQQGPCKLPHALFDTAQIEEVWEHMHGDGRPLSTTLSGTEVMPKAAPSTRSPNRTTNKSLHHIFSTKSKAKRQHSAVKPTKSTRITIRSCSPLDGAIFTRSGADFLALLVCAAGCPRKGCTDHQPVRTGRRDKQNEPNDDESDNSRPWQNNCGLGLGYALILWPSDLGQGMWRRVGIAQIRMADYAAAGTREDQDLVLI